MKIIYNNKIMNKLKMNNNKVIIKILQKIIILWIVNKNNKVMIIIFQMIVLENQQYQNLKEYKK